MRRESSACDTIAKEIDDRKKASPVLNEIIIPCSRIADDHASPSDDGLLSSSWRTVTATSRVSRVFGRSESLRTTNFESRLDSRRNNVRFRTLAIWEVTVDIGAVKRPRDPNAQCRVDRDFAGFSLSLTSPKSVTEHTRDARVPAAARVLPYVRFPFRYSPTPAPTLISCPGRTPRKRARTGPHAPSPSPRLRCLSLARCLVYVWCVTVSIFHSFLFLSIFRRQTYHVHASSQYSTTESTSFFTMLHKQRPKRIRLNIFKSGQFYLKLLYHSQEKIVVSFQETNLSVLRFDIALITVRIAYKKNIGNKSSERIGQSQSRIVEKCKIIILKLSVVIGRFAA